MTQSYKYWHENIIKYNGASSDTYINSPDYINISRPTGF